MLMGVVMGLTITLLIIFTLLMLAINALYYPKEEYIEYVISAVKATYPESRVLNIVAFIEEHCFTKLKIAECYSILIMLEKEGVVESFTKEGKYVSVRDKVVPIYYWRVIKQRGKKIPHSNVNINNTVLAT